MTTKYVAYYRVSTQQQGQSGLGLEAQQMQVKNFVGDNEILKHFIEVESGKNNNRPELKRAIEMAKKEQEEIIDIFEKLDKHYIFHKDANPLNFMYDKDKKLKMIDFGFAEMIEEDSKVKNPNMEYMVLGLLIKLQKFFPGVEYKYLYKKLSKEQKEILS